MAQLLSDRRDIDFVIHEQVGITKDKKFKEFKKKMVDMIITEARNLAIKEFLPTQQPGDEEGCTLENGVVKVPESYHRANKLFLEGEWLAMADDPAVGGQGFPRPVGLGASEYFHAANTSLMLYYGMTHGAAKLVEKLGTEKQQELYMEKMFAGKWGGTMLLTEPEAGSDVGALTTTAVKNDDGTYTINGAKIFISAGEHNMVDNIVHPVLARIEGAPAGTKGISLFLVSKYHVNDDGSLGDFNNVVCTGIEEKMGIHGNATCSLSLTNSIGTLLGQENKGMPHMFLMMNEARHFVGLQGFGVSTAAYMYALDYARTRIQGRHLTAGKDPDAKDVAIIEHPDVRRQLLTMKAYVDGMRSLLYFNGKTLDDVDCCTDEAEKARLAGLSEVLTPFVKGYCTDRALEVTSHAVQVYGGYGFIKEYPVEQLMRDSRIFMIYEGTNGIQAMDLMGRKLSMNKGQAYADFMAEIEKTILLAKDVKGIEGLTEKVENTYNRAMEVSKLMAEKSRSAEVMNAYATAHPFFEAMGDLVMAWMLLWRAAIAAPELSRIVGSDDAAAINEKAEKNKDAAFYLGQIRTAEFFAETLLPVTLGKFDAVVGLSSAAVDMPDASFGSK